MSVDVTGWADALQGFVVGRVVVHDLSRDLACLDDLLLTVDVSEEGIQSLCTLDRTAFNNVPFAGGKHARDQVKGNKPFRVAPFAIDGKRHPDLSEQGLGFGVAGEQTVGAMTLNPGCNRVVFWSVARAGQHFVKHASNFGQSTSMLQ